MLHKGAMQPAGRWRAPVAGALRALCALGATSCALFQPAPPPPPPPAPAVVEPPAPAPAPAPVPAPAPLPDPANAGDLAARQLVACDEQQRLMGPLDLAAEISRLGSVVSSTQTPAPGDVLCLALALAQQHNPGDLARAASLLEPIAQPTVAEPSPVQALARLLAGRIAEQKRLEDELERQAAQRRDTQRAIQQLTEKLEALKAIERSMTARPPASAGAEAAPAPKTP